MEAYVIITREDGSAERFPIEADQVTIGKSGTAGIALPEFHELELEHLLVAPRKEGCWVSTSEGALTPTLHKGKPFGSGMLPWGSELSIGRLHIRLTDRRARSPISNEEGGARTRVLLLAAVAIASYAGYVFLLPKPVGLPSDAGIEPPALFAESYACPRNGDAGANALDAEYRAFSHADRYAFDPADGVRAVELFGEAKTCWSSAGQADRARRAGEFQAELVQEVDTQYATARLTLARAISGERWDLATEATERLQALTKHLDEEDPYVNWLSRVHRIVVSRMHADEDRDSREDTDGRD